MDLIEDEIEMFKPQKFDKMKIKLNELPILVGRINKQMFEVELKKKVDFKAAVKKSLKIEHNQTDEQNLEELKNFIWLGFDWYDFVMNFKNYKAARGAFVDILVFKIEIENFTQYTPDVMTSNYELNYDVETKHFEDYLFMLNDTNNKQSLNKNIERMLCTRLIDYTNKNWTLEWKNDGT